MIVVLIIFLIAAVLFPSEIRFMLKSAFYIIALFLLFAIMSGRYVN